MGENVDTMDAPMALANEERLSEMAFFQETVENLASHPEMELPGGSSDEEPEDYVLRLRNNLGNIRRGVVGDRRGGDVEMNSNITGNNGGANRNIDDVAANIGARNNATNRRRRYVNRQPRYRRNGLPDAEDAERIQWLQSLIFRCNGRSFRVVQHDARRIDHFPHEEYAALLPVEDPVSIIPIENSVPDDWHWDLKNKSCGALIHLQNPRIALFHPEWSVGAAGVRGTKKLNGTRTYWEIEVSFKILGTSTMFGIGTKYSKLGVADYVNLLGEDQHSWGLNHHGTFYHNGIGTQFTHPFKEQDRRVTIGILYDGIAGELSYFKNGQYLGVATKELKLYSLPVYPFVATTAAKVQMRLVELKCEIPQLQHFCREVINKNAIWADVPNALYLPNKINTFLLNGYDPSSAVSNKPI